MSHPISKTKKLSKLLVFFDYLVDFTSSLSITYDIADGLRDQLDSLWRSGKGSTIGKQGIQSIDLILSTGENWEDCFWYENVVHKCYEKR